MYTLFNPAELGFSYNKEYRAWYIILDEGMFSISENMYDMWSISHNRKDTSFTRPNNKFLAAIPDLHNKEFVEALYEEKSQYDSINEMLDCLRAYLRVFIRNKFIDETLDIL